MTAKLKKRKKQTIGRDFNAWAFKNRDGKFAPLTGKYKPGWTHDTGEWVKVKFVQVK